MTYRRIAAILATGITALACAPAGAHAQVHDAHEHGADVPAHAMWMAPLGGGWHLMAMGHAFPALTFAAPFESDSPLHTTDFVFPHAAAMANLESPGSRWVLRVMPNFEGITMPGGEVTPGGWGEGFIDSRHPHTLLHEAMLSFNWWEAPGGALSISAGRGFAPYGTDDPMYRPALKYPTNHHLSQILERWTLNAAYAHDSGWGIEAGIFDGDEPEDPWDMGNFRNFPNSWSARVSRWFGGVGPHAPWQLSASYGRVLETHGGHHEELTHLYNAAVRHQGEYAFGRLYGLLEASVSDPRDREGGDDPEGYFSVLGETQVGIGRHEPFARVEYATRPEYEREEDDFFRYDHDDHAIGATRWLITTFGYSVRLTDLPVGLRPFVEAQHHTVRHERGPADLDPEHLFGTDGFWAFSVGVRVYLGGGPMRMGTYGVLDPMTVGMRAMDHHEPHHPMPHEEHEHGPHAEDGPREHEHGEMMHDCPCMRTVMPLVTALLRDPEVEARIHAVQELHEAWADPAVQRHLEMMRMHGEHHEHPRHERHEDDPAHPHDGHEMMDHEGMMGPVRTFVLRLLADPEVEARIHAVPELHEAWTDPAVQRHLEMMRRMEEPRPHHQHHDGHGSHGDHEGEGGDPGRAGLDAAGCDMAERCPR